MRGKCEVKGCEMPDIASKINEDFEAIIHGVCWKCGERLKEIIGYEEMNMFLFVIDLIEKELE